MILQKILDAAVQRIYTYKEKRWSYIVNTLLGGIYIGFGMLLLITFGGQLMDAPYTKLVQGATFGVALTMVILAGADLFTGNAFIMPISTFAKKTTLLETIQLFIMSYVGNLVGALLLGGTFVATSLVQENLANYINIVTTTKTSLPFLALFARGVLCNVLVCLAVWGSFKLQSEGAKIAFIFCCIMPFIAMSFEHSIANMTLFAVAYFMPGSSFTLAEFATNLIPVTTGNILGGLFVAYVYWQTLLKEENCKL